MANKHKDIDRLVSDNKYVTQDTFFSNLETLIRDFDVRVHDIIVDKMDAYCNYMQDATRRFHLLNKKDKLRVVNGKKSNTSSSLTVVHVDAKAATLYGLSFNIDITSGSHDKETISIANEMKEKIYQTSNYSEKAKDALKRMISHGDYFVRWSVDVHIGEEIIKDKEGKEEKIQVIQWLEGDTELIPFGAIIYDEEESYDQQDMIIYRRYQNAYNWIRKWKKRWSKIIDRISKKDIIEKCKTKHYMTETHGQIYMYESIMDKYGKYMDYEALSYNKDGECSNINETYYFSDSYNRLAKAWYGECIEVRDRDSQKIVLILNGKELDTVDNPYFGGKTKRRWGVRHPFHKLSFNNYWTKPISRSLPQLLKETHNTSTMLLNVYKDQILASMNRITFMKWTGSLSDGHTWYNHNHNRYNLDNRQVIDLPPNVEIEEYYEKPNNDIFTLYNYQFEEAARIANMDRYTWLLSQGSKERVKTGAEQVQKVEEYSLWSMGDALKHMTNNLFRSWFIDILKQVEAFGKDVHRPRYVSSKENNIEYMLINPDPTISLDFSINYETEALNEYKQEQELDRLSRVTLQMKELMSIDRRVQEWFSPINFDALYAKFGKIAGASDMIQSLEESIRSNMEREHLTKKIRTENSIDNDEENGMIEWADEITTEFA